MAEEAKTVLLASRGGLGLTLDGVGSGRCVCRWLRYAVRALAEEEQTTEQRHRPVVVGSGWARAQRTEAVSWPRGIRGEPEDEAGVQGRSRTRTACVYAAAWRGRI